MRELIEINKKYFWEVGEFKVLANVLRGRELPKII